MRRLTVLRHAKSDWPSGVADHARPLGERGRRDAPVAGGVLAGGPAIDLVVCSTAARTRQTWELVSEAFAVVPPVTFNDAVYEAAVVDLLTVIDAVGPDVSHLLLIGHNPGCADLILQLADPTAAALRQQVATKFPTSAIAALEFDDPGRVGPGTGRLQAVTVPRG